MTSELVAQQVAALRNILRDHPDVIRLADPELQFLSWLADKFAMDYVAEAKRLIAEIGGQEAKSEDNSWRLPNINELIPNELPLPTIWPNEIQNPEPLIPGWQIPWGYRGEVRSLTP